MSAGSRGRTKRRDGNLAKSEAQDAEAQGFRQGAISIFIFFHLIAIICWTIPTDYLFMVESGSRRPLHAVGWPGAVVGHLRP